MADDNQGDHSNQQDNRSQNERDDRGGGDHDHEHTYRLGARTASLVLHGPENMVFVNGGHATITDTPLTAAGGDRLELKVGPHGGTVDLTNFSTARGVVDLVPGLGFTTAAQAAAYVNAHSDGAGGSLLVFNGGSIDFRGIAPGSFSAHDFKVT